jgi:hypothetical protein
VSIRKRGSRAYQVRVAPFPAQTVPTRDAAEKLELDLKLRRSLGELYEGQAVCLGEAIDGTLARIEAMRGPRSKTTEFNRRCAKFWEPLRETRVPLLRRARIEDMTVARAQEHPRSAKNELEFLKRVLHEAKGRGQRVDGAISTACTTHAYRQRVAFSATADPGPAASWGPRRPGRAGRRTG